MIRAAVLAALSLAAASAPARADDRRVTVGAIDRVRVLGPFEVVVGAERAPDVTLSGSDAAIQAVDVALDGGTLTLRGRIGDRQGQGTARPVTIRLGSDGLAGASVVGGGRLTIERMRGARVDVTVTGAGTIAVGDLRADTTVATAVGAATMTLAGRTGTARLLTNGTGTIDAAALDAGDLIVRLEGPGMTSARARYTAQVANTGLGRVTVAGAAKCRITAPAGGTVTCGDTAPPG